MLVLCSLLWFHIMLNNTKLFCTDWFSWISWSMKYWALYMLGTSLQYIDTVMNREWFVTSGKLPLFTYLYICFRSTREHCQKDVPSYHILTLLLTLNKSIQPFTLLHQIIKDTEYDSVFLLTMLTCLNRYRLTFLQRMNHIHHYHDYNTSTNHDPHQ